MPASTTTGHDDGRSVLPRSVSALEAGDQRRVRESFAEDATWMREYLDTLYVHDTLFGDDRSLGADPT